MLATFAELQKKSNIISLQYLLSLSGVGQLGESSIAINLTFSLGKLAFRLENWPISQENVYFLSKTDLLARKRVFSAGDARFRWKTGVQKSNIIAIVAVLAGNIQYQYLLSCKSIFIQSLSYLLLGADMGDQDSLRNCLVVPSQGLRRCHISTPGGLEAVPGTLHPA